MGKVTGFLDYSRLHETYEPVEKRRGHYREFVLRLTDADASVQGARCMDCGIPFCNTGCPVHNLIPDWNDLVFHGHWRKALDALHATNNFPEFTGRVCPAPCEAACTLNINTSPVGIKSIERFIIDKAWENAWVLPHVPRKSTGKRVAIVGSGPAGLAAAQQLTRAGHAVTVFEKNDRIGGLLRYGIPDFKLEKHLLDRRIEQLRLEGVKFHTRVKIGRTPLPSNIANDAIEVKSTADLEREFDAVILAIGAEVPRDLLIPGRELAGVYAALEFLIPQNKALAGEGSPLPVKNKHVVVIGGGDTGADCVGTANRGGAASVTQLELMPMPPTEENKALTWPYWPLKLRTSSSHDEGCTRDFAVTTHEFISDGRGRVRAISAARVAWKDGTMTTLAGSEFVLPADLVFLAMGFASPSAGLLNEFGIEPDSRGNAPAETTGANAYATPSKKVFAAGDVRRGQSLVVWAIHEGRQCARAVDAFLMNTPTLAD